MWVFVFFFCIFDYFLVVSWLFVMVRGCVVMELLIGESKEIIKGVLKIVYDIIVFGYLELCEVFYVECFKKMCG